MKQIKRTHINIKTREVLIVRGGNAPPEIRCPHCGVDVEILTPEQAIERQIRLLPDAQVRAAAMVGEPEVTAYSETKDLDIQLDIQEEK